MKTETNLTAGISESEKVDEFMGNLKYPLSDVVQYLRELILNTGKQIGEGIFWNAPTYYFTGKLKTFNPKEYKRYIVGFNLFKRDCVRLIFLRGVSVNDTSGLLEGEFAFHQRVIFCESSKKSDIAATN